MVFIGGNVLISRRTRLKYLITSQRQKDSSKFRAIRSCRVPCFNNNTLSNLESYYFFRRNILLHLLRLKNTAFNMISQKANGRRLMAADLRRPSPSPWNERLLELFSTLSGPFEDRWRYNPKMTWQRPKRNDSCYLAYAVLFTLLTSTSLLLFFLRCQRVAHC